MSHFLLAHRVLSIFKVRARAIQTMSTKEQLTQIKDMLCARGWHDVFALLEPTDLSTSHDEELPAYTEKPL